MTVVNLLRAVCFAVLASSPTMARDIRPASEQEMAAALVGCWEREEPAGSQGRLSMCFGPGDQLTTTWTDSRPNASQSKGHTRKTFSVVDGKLRIVGGPVPEWHVLSSERVCDVLMQLDVAMRLANYIEKNDFGTDVISEPLYDSSYAKVRG